MGGDRAPPPLHTYLPTYLPTCLHTYLPAYYYSYLPTYLHTYSYLPTYLHTYLHTYLPTYWTPGPGPPRAIPPHGAFCMLFDRSASLKGLKATMSLRGAKALVLARCLRKVFILYGPGMALQVCLPHLHGRERPFCYNYCYTIYLLLLPTATYYYLQMLGTLLDLCLVTLCTSRFVRVISASAA